MKQFLHTLLTSLRSENARSIRSSETWRLYRLQALVFGIGSLVLTAILGYEISHMILHPREYLTLDEFLFYIFYVVYVGYFLFSPLRQLLQLLHHADGYVFHEAVLENPAAQYRTITFSVTLPGHSQTFRTLPVHPNLVSHTGHQALVAYNPKTQLTVLIRPLDDTLSDSAAT